MLPSAERRSHERTAERAGARCGEEPGELDRPDPKKLRLRRQELDVRPREQRRRDAEHDDPQQHGIATDERETLLDRFEQRKTRAVIDRRLRTHQEEGRDDRQV